MNKISLTCYVLIILLSCCKKPFNAPASSTSNSYLVVEGIINSGNDSTIIKLSKTVKLTDSVATKPLLGASVTVEGDAGYSTPLVDATGTGNYGAAPLNLSPAQKYRVNIRTSDGNYVSDYVAVKPTPPIDSIGFNLSFKDSTVNLYVNAHDQANATRYYRWEYHETWIFHAKYFSGFVLSGGSIVTRQANQLVYYCFTDNNSPNILLNSTSNLAKDVVFQQPLAHIPLTSEKFERKYSILVKQYALTPESYQFYENIKKNTEQLGSIFDAQPTELKGNIHKANNPLEPVIGYITVTNTQSKRIFIVPEQLPQFLLAKYPYDCEEGSAFYGDKMGHDVQDILINPPLTDIPTSAILSPGGTIIGYKYSTSQCVDCTLRGYTRTPPFWQ